MSETFKIALDGIKVNGVLYWRARDVLLLLENTNSPFPPSTQERLHQLINQLTQLAKQQEPKDE